MSDYVTQAYAKVPGYTETLAAWKRAKNVRLDQPTTTIASVETSARRNLIAGDDVGDLPAQIGHARGLAESWEAATAMVAALVRGFEADVALARQTGASVALTWLNTQLLGVVDPFQALSAALKDLTDADTAIKSGPEGVDVWSRLQTAGTAVAEIRKAQRVITQAAFLGDDAATMNAGRNLSRFGVIRHATLRDPLASEGKSPDLSLSTLLGPGVSRLVGSSSEASPWSWTPKLPELMYELTAGEKLLSRTTGVVSGLREAAAPHDIITVTLPGRAIPV